jgi:hypothetical protein
VGNSRLLAASLRGALAPPPPIRPCANDFVRDAGQWKIDDIKGSADGRPCPSAALLAASLKYQGFQR